MLHSGRLPRFVAAMSSEGPSASRPPRLAERLAAARRFVGRADELELFSAALAAEAPPFAALHLYGPGGVGKSSLLGQFARQAVEAGRLTVLLDCRNLDVSPQGVRMALSQAMGLPEGAAPLEALARAGRPVLLLDTYETLAPLDGWLRETFLPQLPAGALVVIAGRNPPSPAWRTDAGWRDLVRSVSLRNLRPEESRAYLTQRGVPPAQHAAVLGFTHGHPLALSLVTDVTAQAAAHGVDTAFHPDQAPDVVALLLERFIQDVPGARHRLALHACAVARVINEPLLREALGESDVADVFAWLRALSFIEQGPAGLFPHDLAREVLDSDLRWRDPHGYAELHRSLRGGIVRRITDGQGLEQMRAVYDLVFLHRHNSILQPYFHWKEFGTLYAEPVRPDEHAALLDRVAAFTGGAAAEQAVFWLARQPEAWFVIRDVRGRMAGVFMYLAVHAAAPEDRRADPAVEAAWQYAQQRAPLRPGDEVALSRYFLQPSDYREPNPVMNTAQLATALRWMTNPRLAWSFNDLYDPDHWFAMMSYYDFHRVPDLGPPPPAPSSPAAAQRRLWARRFGLYAHNWRATPVMDWIEKIGGRELATDLRVEELAAASSTLLVVLSQPEFEAAAKDALRDFHSLSALAGNALMRSRVLKEAAAGGPAAASLQELMRQAAESLRARPRDEKFFRALEATYLIPVATQELAAERLGLPFSTYRYQLAQGLERLVAWLWQRELYGADGADA